jgi:ABC-type nitrate/sulfonate/bicarbonate transport system substrate-binding protein
MVAERFWTILFVVLFAASARAEQIKIAYSGVSAAGTPLWLAEEEGIFNQHGLGAATIAPILQANL